MRADLSALDVAIVAAYLLGMVLLGGWFARRQTGLGTYFVGGRDVAWWLVLASIVATETSTVTFLSIPGLAYSSGGNLAFLQLALGYVVGRVVVAWLLVPLYVRGEVLSAYQVLRERFDAGVQRTASGLFLATRTVADGLRLYLTALLLHQFTGWDQYVAVLVIGAATVLYTLLGGMEAVVWTDLIQLLIYLAGAIFAGVILLSLLPGGLAQYAAVGEAAGKFTWLDLSTDLSKPLTLWAGLIGGAFFSMASHGADQLMVQRYLCSRSVGQARLALVLSGVAVLLQFLLFLLLGVGLYVLAQADVLTVPAGTRNDEVFGLFIVKFLPTGVIGLVVAAVLAAAMSTLSSSLNSSAGAFVVDFYRPLRPGRDEGHYLATARGMTALFGLAQVAVALVTMSLQGERSVVDQVLTVAGFTTGAVLGLFVLGGLGGVSSRAALVGLAAGFVAVSAAWWSAALAWPWYAPVGTVTTVAVALAVSRAFPAFPGPEK